jgi:hypothetical protein
MFNLGIFLEQLSKTAEYLSQDTPHPGRDSNLTPPECNQELCGYTGLLDCSVSV